MKKIFFLFGILIGFSVVSYTSAFSDYVPLKSETQGFSLTAGGNSISIGNNNVFALQSYFCNLAPSNEGIVRLSDGVVSTYFPVSRNAFTSDLTPTLVFSGTLSLTATPAQSVVCYFHGYYVNGNTWDSFRSSSNSGAINSVTVPVTNNNSSTVTASFSGANFNVSGTGTITSSGSISSNAIVPSRSLPLIYLSSGTYFIDPDSFSFIAVVALVTILLTVTLVVFARFAFRLGVRIINNSNKN